MEYKGGFYIRPFSGITENRKDFEMNYCGIKKCDIANGIGVRVTLFVSGCTHHCKGCFQPETWDFNYGDEFTQEVEEEIIAALAPSYIHGLTLLGGEPFEPQNQRVLVDFLKKVRTAYPKKTVWCYTGYLLDEELLKPSRARCEVTDEMLGLIDVLVDGEFEIDKKNISLQFCGSENQRLIDLNKTRNEGKIVIWKE